MPLEMNFLVIYISDKRDLLIQILIISFFFNPWLFLQDTVLPQDYLLY